MTKHTKSVKGGSNLVELAVPAAFVYANNNYSKGTMLSKPKKLLKKTVKGLKRTVRRATSIGTPRSRRSSRRSRRSRRSRGRR